MILSNEELEEIRKRYEHYETTKPNTAVNDIRILLAEVDRLKEFEWMYEDLQH